MYSYMGAFHIHSTFSDGTAEIPKIIEFAKKAGLKWIVISDHNNLKGYEFEGFHNGVCTIVGSEISPDKSNHLVAVNIEKEIDKEIGPRNYINEVHKQNGICFVAHPDESINRQNNYAPLRWEDWTIDSFDGLEIWNYLSDWTDNYSNNKNPFLQQIFRHKIISGPSKQLLNWWDELNNKSNKPVAGIGGVDAHCFLINKFGLTIKISDYYDYFSTLNNIIYLSEPLSEDFKIAKNQIISALKNANFDIINRQVKKSKKLPEIYVENKEEKFFPGSCIPFEKTLKLKVDLYQKGIIKIIYNGICIEEFLTKSLEYDALKEGKYRIEVIINNIPYIFSNYFFIE